MTQVGQTRFDPIPIGEVAKPPFVQLPDSLTLFTRRAQRLRSLAERHELGAYLTFHRRLERRPAPSSSRPTSLPAAAGRGYCPRPDSSKCRRLTGRVSCAMPRSMRCGTASLAALGAIDMPDGARRAMERVRAADAATQDAMVAAVLDDMIPAAALAEHALVAAVTQVHYARLAAQLDPKTLVPVGEGICPAAGRHRYAAWLLGGAARKTRGSALAHCAARCGIIRASNARYVARPRASPFKRLPADRERSRPKPATPAVITSRYCSSMPIACSIRSPMTSRHWLSTFLLGRSKYRRGGVNPFLLGY